MLERKKNSRRFIGKRKIELLFYLLSHCTTLFYLLKNLGNGGVSEG